MRYSEMAPWQRERLLADPANYPLKVTFLGKVGLLNAETIDLLRANGVDFVLDDAQTRQLLAGEPTTTGTAVDPAAPPLAALEGLPAPARPRRRPPLPSWLLGTALGAALLAAAQRLGRRR
ncbi:MAG: hypothetical protein ACYC4L_16750 [Chloroflexota bacterium]